MFTLFFVKISLFFPLLVNVADLILQNLQHLLSSARIVNDEEKKLWFFFAEVQFFKGISNYSGYETRRRRKKVENAKCSISFCFVYERKMKLPFVRQRKRQLRSMQMYLHSITLFLFDSSALTEIESANA